jgi:hypothetical protein
MQKSTQCKFISEHAKTSNYKGNLKCDGLGLNSGNLLSYLFTYLITYSIGQSP